MASVFKFTLNHCHNIRIVKRIFLFLSFLVINCIRSWRCTHAYSCFLPTAFKHIATARKHSAG